jgi:DNA-binding transcriptional ArsR family regulator
MLALTLDVADMASLRFAYSPIQEAVQSLWAWRRPERHPAHETWLRAGAPYLKRLDWPLLESLVGPAGWIPDFLTPYPASEAPRFDEELEQLRSTPPARVRRDISVACVGPALQAAAVTSPLAGYDQAPAVLRDAIADALQQYWDLLFVPHWPRMRDVLDSDISYRSRQLVVGGANALFADLDDNLRWTNGRVEVDAVGLTVDDHVDGRGLVLTPSLFAKHANTMIDSELPPVIAYPARGRAQLWHASAQSPAALASLLGATRAEILVALAEPATTTQLAARLALTPGGVSQHLSTMHRSGLLRRRRVARVVTYEQSDLGALVVQAADSGDG